MSPESYIPVNRQPRDCHSCPGCGPASQRQRKALNDVDVSSLMAVLWHSWLMPLLFAVLGCAVALSFGLSDPISLLLSVTAFVIGTWLCKPIEKLEVM